EGDDLLAGRSVPELHGAVTALGGQQPAVGREGQGLNCGPLLRQTRQLVSPRNIPQPDFARPLAPIPGARSAGENLAVVGKGNAGNGLLVPVEDMDLPLVSDIPEANRAVVTARRKHLTIRGEREAPDIIAMAEERALLHF